MAGGYKINKEEVLDIVVQQFRKATVDFKAIGNALVTIYSKEWWREVTPSGGLGTKHFDTFFEWLEAPSPWGCDSTKEAIMPILKEQNLLAYNKIRGWEDASNKNGTNQYSGCDNITPSDRGDDPTYKVRRLQRDAPEYAAKVLAGELSPNAAYIEAGFAKRKQSFTIDKDGILKLFQKLSVDDRSEFMEILMDEYYK